VQRGFLVLGKASAKTQVQEEPVTEAETPLKTKKTAVRKDASASPNIWWKCSNLLFLTKSMFLYA